MAELKDETFFQLGNKTQLLQKVRELCHTYGFEPKMGYLRKSYQSHHCTLLEKESGCFGDDRKNWLHRLKRKQLSVVRWRLIWCQK